MIYTKPHDLPACGFSVTIPLKVPEHDLCKCLRIAAQHVTNHEILNYADSSLKWQVIAQSEKVIQFNQMRDMPHALTIIPMFIPDPALVKQKVSLA
ncbi:MAG: hypothetical protein OER82_09035 [Nitrosopumilus sp.]|nr:hypothetical protein [Nitrosopumilus sp.]MDH3765940.1 hypothetical protein [Nitrosopumilus sp.]